MVIAEQPIDLRITGPRRDRLLEVIQRLLLLPHRAVGPCQSDQTVGAQRGVIDDLTVERQRLFAPAADTRDIRHRQTHLTQPRVHRLCTRTCLPRPIKRHGIADPFQPRDLCATDPRLRTREMGIVRQRLTERGHGPLVAGFADRALQQRQPTQVMVVGVDVVGWRQPLRDFGGLPGQMAQQRVHDLARDLPLQGEYIVDFPIIGLGPQGEPGTHIGQTRTDPHPATFSSHAGIEQRRHAQAAPDPAHIALAFNGSSQLPRRHFEAGHVGQCVVHFHRQTVSEIAVVGIVAEAAEWHHRNGGAGHCRARRRGIRPPPPSAAGQYQQGHAQPDQQHA
ncbi:hypothetical protein D3C81_888000 [compost metagenome]